MNFATRITFCGLFFILFLFNSIAVAQVIELEKKHFTPGEEIKVYFTASGDFAENAWIGIIPSNINHGSESVNDKHDLTYQYLKKRNSGILTFKAPSKEGEYDFRMHDTDNDGREINSVSFVVASSKTTERSSLQLNKSIFLPGEEIQVHFTTFGDFADNAWVGIIPSHVSHGKESVNDKYDLSYQYLKKRTSGILIFKAPLQEGNYDFRMHDTDNDGHEIASVSFKISK